MAIVACDDLFLRPDAKGNRQSDYGEDENQNKNARAHGAEIFKHRFLQCHRFLISGSGLQSCLQDRPMKIH
jgi:hypothetical protein